MSTILDLQKKYYKKIDQFDLDLIFEDILKKPRAFILAHPEFTLTTTQTLKIKSFADRRKKGEPLAYILGHKEFYGLDFIVNKNVLVPRPETEMMVEEIISSASTMPDAQLVDIGTGSGCIAITLAKKLDKEIIAIDISSKALSVAKKNAKAMGISDKIRFMKGNLFDPVLKNINVPGNGLIIAANLPYVESGWKKMLKSPERIGLKFEPSIALYSGKDGLDHYRELAGQVKELRSKTGQPITLFCEINHKQATGMKKIFSFAKKLEIKKDHNGRFRLAIIKI